MSASSGEIVHAPEADRRDYETDAVRLVERLARRRSWACEVETSTRFCARLTIGARRRMVIGADLGLNSSAARRVARDKLFSLDVLGRDGFRVVPTVRMKDEHDIDPAGPTVVKPNRSHGGAGVSVVRSPTEAGPAFEAAAALDPIVICQPLVELPEFRLLVLEARLCFAVGRRRAPGQAAANLARGGSWEICTERVDPKYARIAADAADALGLTLAGIDLFARDIGAFDERHAILEVNATPGLKAISTVPAAADAFMDAVGARMEREAREGSP